MAEPFLQFPFGTQRFSSYTADAVNASPDQLSRPSINCIITETGKVETRLGFIQEFSIGVDGSGATAFYHKTYDAAFFALGTAVYYRDFATGNTYNTGITLTAGTTTRFAEFFGDIYLCNSTDGIIRIMVARVNDAAANAGDATITIDADGAARLSVFGDTSGNLRIRGTNEAFASLVVSTGVVTLTGTLSQAYSDNDIAIFIDNSYSALEDPSKILFWKSRMHIMGFPSPTNADQPNNSVMAGQFVIGQTGASGIENIIDFTYGTGGSTKITVGAGGRVTNVLGVEDAIYFFTEDQVFSTLSSEVNAETPSASSPGSGLGLTIPRAKDNLHGCLNEDSAIVIGYGEVAYITNDRRFMRIRVSTDSGAAVSYPDETFDIDIRELLEDMDRDQTGALAFHYRGQRKSIFQVKILGQWYWLIYDHNILRQVGSTVTQGAWQPPQQVVAVRSFFERNGVLYGTDAVDDSVYSFFTTFDDNFAPIYSIVATGEFNVGNAMLEKAQLQGDINQPCRIKVRCYVTNEQSGRRSGSQKIIDGNSYTYTEDNSIGAVPVGDGGVEAEATQVAKWRREFDVFPSEGSRAQLIAENEESGGYFSISSFAITGKQFPSTFKSAL